LIPERAELPPLWRRWTFRRAEWTGPGRFADVLTAGVGQLSDPPRSVLIQKMSKFTVPSSLFNLSGYPRFQRDGNRDGS